jgi:hypothetical protein
VIKTDYSLEVLKSVFSAPETLLDRLLAFEMGHVYISETFAKMTEAVLMGVVGVACDPVRGRASWKSRDDWERQMKFLFQVGLAAMDAAEYLYDTTTNYGGGSALVPTVV